jgi:hypothetical protein
MNTKPKRLTVSARFNVVLSEELNQAVDAVVTASETTKSEILRKARNNVCRQRG